MGENSSTNIVQQSRAERIQEDIRHTEAEITDTVHTLEDRLSPKNLRRQAFRKARQAALQGAINVLDMVQRKPVQVALAGAGALGMLLLRKKMRSRSTLALAGPAARGFVNAAARSVKSGSERSGQSVMWRGLASALGAAISTLWYRRRAAR